MKINEIRNHYSKGLVKKEISDYSKNRWVAIYGLSRRSGVFLRYWRNSKQPLTFSSIAEFDKAMKQFGWIFPRTFYATANLFRDLSDRSKLDDKSNIIASTPVWDIDGALNFWRKVLEVARIIVDELDKEGISKSVYLIWSGRGIHVHVHERSISEELRRKYNPLDLSYSIVEYILRKCREKIIEIAKEAKDPERPLKVENEMDIKRVFTTPLSLHKSVDYVAIVFKPNEIDDFDLDWANPNKFRHNRNWRSYEEGEADELALKAIKEIGGYFNRVGEIRTVVGLQKERNSEMRETIVRVIRGNKKIGRFQVIALLQAARYFILRGDVNKAKSFGLNRAIFYAWAKHYRVGRAHRGRGSGGDKKRIKFEYLGDEQAPISPRGLFVMGDQEQRPEDFDKEVIDKINSIIPFKLAWDAAINYLKRFPERVLLSQQEFFKKVYDPVKDDFINKVVLGKKESITLIDFMKKKEKENSS